MCRFELKEALSELRLLIRNCGEPVDLLLDGMKIEVDSPCRSLPQGFRELYLESAEFALAAGMHVLTLAGPTADYPYLPAAVLVGNRMERAGGMPWARRLTNRWMSRSLSKLMRQWVPDTQCGFRLYHRSAFPVEAPAKGERRFAAESAELLRLALEGVRIGTVPVQTIYADERSKIRPLRDAARYWWMLRRFKRAKRNLRRLFP